MKTCSTCHEVKPFTEFNVMARASDGRQPRCRDCCKAWYVANREQHKANTAQRRRDYLGLCRRRIWAYLDEHPCVDCGEDDARILEFDHRDPAAKKANVAFLLRAGGAWSDIAAEIAKCDVRCANCHRRRTSEQFGSWRQAAWSVESTARADRVRARLFQVVPQVAPREC